ncbi:protein ITPRID1 isoform X1 [Tachysurus fulvidraco]|uniref:protein ITPRID1 isoform X1 n=2 Tax=Tachysurus fulvidraco TaxID=1234273 RepID=UPI001FEF6768|nr:protein ITPRID1 isoform X1 [Tachysurus fulvidraco]XP_027004547.2 protein ITPRID1 isoform X1 [Tachysurus fulvidraco]
MDADHVDDKRARLLASRSRWSEIGGVTSTQPITRAVTEKYNQDSINMWNIHINKDAKQMSVQEYTAQDLKETGMSEDNVALFSKECGKNTVQGFLSSYPERPPLTSAWNSLTSGITGHSGPPSAMDVLNLWQDDPEELLLDLGFGAEEPDITVKIPARFINHQSQARGINLKVFLEAQQNRIDIENPDVRNRFRQIEVLQQVTTAFNSLVGGAIPGAQKPVELSEEARVRRKRVGMLFRNASKKSLSRLTKYRDEQPLSPSLAGQPYSPELPGDLPIDKRIPLKRGSLSPLVEEQTLISEGAESTETTSISQFKSSSPRAGKELKNVTSVISSAKAATGMPAESFELEEIQSFDEGSIGGICTGTADQPGSNVRAYLTRVRTNSCQSDSSGFLEEPFVPAYPNPGPELMKVLNAMSGDSTESPQKSMDQEIHPPYTQDPDKLLKQTEFSSMDSNINGEMGPAHNRMIISVGYTTKSHLQDTDRTDYLENKKVLQKDIVGNCVGESTIIQEDSPGLHDNSANAVQNTTLQKDSPVLHDYGGSFNESEKFLNNLSPSGDVVVDRDSQMKIWKSDVSVYKTDSSSTDPKAGTENNVPFSTIGYYGRSVSVQMCSSLASQSSLRGSISHNSPARHSPTSDSHLRRESRDQLDSDVANISDKARSTNTTTTMEHTLSKPWLSQETFKGPYSLDKARSYEEDTRWEAALWSGVQICGSCRHKQRCCCQNKISEKQYSGSTEHLNPTSSLPYSMDELISMMRCMWKFRKMLTELEERLEEEQETVNSSFSDEHRAELQDILKLRTAVKQESEMLEQQLSELVKAYDDNMKMKMSRLLDEQSHLCTQLRFTPQPGHISKKSVAIQCTLLTDSPESCLSTQLTDDTRLIQKAEKLDFVGFIRSLKDGSINNDSLE